MKKRILTAIMMLFVTLSANAQIQNSNKVVNELNNIKEMIDEGNKKWFATYVTQRKLMIKMAQVIDEQTKELIHLREMVTQLIISGDIDLNDLESKAKEKAEIEIARGEADSPFTKMKAFASPDEPRTPKLQVPKNIALEVKQVAHQCSLSELSDEDCYNISKMQKDGTLACDGGCDAKELFSAYKANPKAFQLVSQIKRNKKKKNNHRVSPAFAPKKVAPYKKKVEEIEPKTTERPQEKTWRPSKLTPINYTMP